MSEILEPHFYTLNELLKNSFLVPVYQRPYSWGKNQVDDMLSDIFSAFKSYKLLKDKLNKEEDESTKKIFEEHLNKSKLYLGNIILHEKTANAYDIIDGQQRITTISIFLLALYSKFYSFNKNFNTDNFNEIKNILWKKIGNNTDKNKRLIELGSIDKEILIRLFDITYSDPLELDKNVEAFEVKCDSQKFVKDNYHIIKEFLNEKFADLNDLNEFTFFILNYVCVITIVSKVNENKVFSIFESINSKGKRLEDIDLIKTRIFSCLNEEDYSTYLSNWGTLIRETKDRLSDYFNIYIKAYIKYYTNDVTYRDFLKLDDELKKHFNKEELKDAYKALIDDLIIKLDCFKAVFDETYTFTLIKNSKFKYYYHLFIKMNYEHPRPLFFRCFCEFKNKELNEDDLVDIMIEVIKFCLVFLTIDNGGSKNAIDAFRWFIWDSNSNKKIIKDWILYRINKKINEHNISKERIFETLKGLDLYSKKQLSAAILSAYDSQYEKDENKQISWDESYSKFSNYGSYELDHIMVQTPDRNDPNLKYYNLGGNLKLKENHDFPSNIKNDMLYDEFKKTILNKIGNLRLKGGDGNSSKGNASDKEFNCYKKLEERNNLICDFFVNKIINLSKCSEDFNSNADNSIRKLKSGNFDFSMEDLDLKGLKPASITICDKTIKIRYLKDILIEVVKYLDSDKLVEMAAEGWKSEQRFILTDNPQNLRSSCEICKNSVYLETNLSGYSIKVYVIKLLDIFNIDKSKVSIYIPEK